MELDAVVVNGVYPERFTGAEARALAASTAAVGRGRAPRCGRRCPSTAARRAERSQLARLRRGVDAPVLTLPFLFEPELGREELERCRASWRRQL